MALNKREGFLWIFLPLLAIFSMFGYSGIQVLKGRGSESFAVGEMTKFEALSATNYDMLVLSGGIVIALVVGLVLNLREYLQGRSLLEKYPKKEKDTR